MKLAGIKELFIGLALFGSVATAGATFLASMSAAFAF